MNKSAENFDRLKLDFIATVSHELRTPLTSIRGFTETLISSRDKLSDEQQLKCLNIIKDQSNRLINLVENLLAATAQASYEEIFVTKPTNIITAVDNAISIVKQKYPRKDFIINLDKNLPSILVDSEKFQQVLLNLIENACKYSFENSIVSINATINDNKFIQLNIENDSETIPLKDQEKIFEKFARLDTPMTRLTQGSGMGLYLTKKMTEKMNGKITVKSENQHTIFSVIFPISTPENIIKNKLSGNNKNSNEVCND